ncbi:VanW family protein [Sutcliffiella rhizosphaerae]|uniref:Vancomycin B-type resistance protein VanW n=1 Tax=Sutcliffiella rhizosphaerae TaxID=2880967 RepID=A0ABM8YKM5_9BACI|nr:VanW family protein [Sutcliffiella rhizosphaerae]CAG9620504.1 Vancomycin B-type resistance protein VanW [Sutcliffiella rhizosphaerae]
MNHVNLRPKKRLALRIWLGTQYYIMKRWLEWKKGNHKYTEEQSEEKLPYKAFLHKTPTLRKLKDVDMWYQHNKVINIKIAVEKLNGVVIRPGETFSYWKLIGKPTKKKGYVEGMVLFYGDFKPGLGGGLCQLSNLIYWMTIHTSLTVTERYRHSFDVFPDSRRTQPFGSGATCSYNYLDLQIRNDTTKAYQLIVSVEGDYLKGEWRTESLPIISYKVYEKEHFITPAYWGGYLRHNIIHRKVFNNQNQQVDDQYITENHAIMMYEPLLESSTQSS